MSERVTDAELAEIERLDQEATPGPWISEQDRIHHEWWIKCKSAERPAVYDGQLLFKISGKRLDPMSRGGAEKDARFVSYARSLLPRMAAELRALRAPVVDVEATLRERVDFLAVALDLDAREKDIAAANLKPFVERAAVLARERDEIYRELEAVREKRDDTHRQLDTARAEIERLKADNETLATENIRAAVNFRGAVSAVVEAHSRLERKKLAPVEPAQAAFERAVLRLLSVLDKAKEG